MLIKIVRFKSILIFASLMLALGACADNVSPADTQAQAFEDLRDEIRDAVDDSTREGEAIKLVDTLAENLQQLQQKLSYRAKRARKLNSDYDTTRGAFETFFKEVDGQIQANRKQVGETQRALFAVLTPDERSSISKIHSKAMKAAIKTIQAI